MAMRTPFDFLADRFTLSSRALRWATTWALVVSILIIFTGGVVRVTGSGLGCPTWPDCNPGSLSPTGVMGIHGIIEFGNRLFSAFIAVPVAWVIIAARLQKPRERSLTRLAWSQFWLVVANAVAGGVTVLAGLNAWVVAMHFVLAIALLTTTTLTWHRVHEKPDAEPVQTTALSRRLSWIIVLVSLVLILVGTLVTGSGPHSGDSAAVKRMPLDWTALTIAHGLLGAAVLVLAIVLWVVLRRDSGAALARFRVAVFIVVVIVQGAIGVTQALDSLPALLVAIHLLGAAFVWVGALRVLLEVNPTLFRGIVHEQFQPREAVSL
ncbi:COX15/CtaA family protein [Parafrigoribacterium humi]|jgi:cytochrome c oxidase assembly protein subunit 15|uniref:COX15/CtaA family protein n=1 Tax=Parafrigoribacterium humi TaxID=3144664 RepID=UPI0032EE8C3A